MAFYLLCALALGFVLVLLGQPWLRAYRQRRVLAHPFPAHWRKVLRRRVPFLRRLPVDLQLQLKKRIQVFIAEKAFIGCDGLQVTEEMRVVIAAQACLLVLNRSMAHLAHVRQILVYPGAFVVQRTVTDGIGMQQDQRQALSGESWEQGQVVLSWQDTLEGAAVVDDGRNVVLHEFAHQLDQENGAAQGAPPPAAGDTQHSPQRWKQVFSQAYAQLQSQVQRGEQGLFNHYGAQSPAEFFAVATETFFEQATETAEQYPALYDELKGYYKVDPASWH
ncbi:M90 family metallopeptidase [Rhodoferax sp. U11-2br]|uniref:M90 family metallopeptidase n=1 Tax=Rhodoferax sp. U11-2br TaxID=2838878 RepID=UPI001BED1DDA|nr:zinc-dependent peptidase [Rhodoferax sp. U11-2br]